MDITPYSLLKSSKGKGVKAVEVITDSQAVFWDNRKGYFSHSGIVSDIEKEMYPRLTEMEIWERESENAHVFLSERDAIIHFPDYGKISIPQFYFLLDFIKEVSKYNREVSSNKKIPIEINGYGKTIIIYDIKEIDENIAKEWRKHIRKANPHKQEIIIGKIYNQENEFMKRNGSVSK